MDGSSTETLLELLPSINALLATKYLAGSAIVVTIWDAMLSLSEEVSYVWPIDLGLTKVVFVLNRYGIIAVLLYVNYMLSGMGHPASDFFDHSPSSLAVSFVWLSHLSNQVLTLLRHTSCKVFMTIMSVLAMVYSLSSNGYIALRLYAIWDQRRSVKTILRVALAITYIPVLVIGGISIVTFYRFTLFVPLFNTCVVMKENVIVKGGFGCMFAFDVFVILLTTFNALDRPRGPQHKLLENIRRDGSVWFFMLCLMRLLNFLIYVFLPPEQIFVVLFITWAMISITLSRMILRVEAMKKPPKRTKVNTWIPARDAFQLEEWSRQSHGASNPGA